MEGAAFDCERIIASLYDALEVGNVATICSMISEDLDWQFHGPPAHQHLMRMLTGADRLGSFSFNPTQICIVGDRVFVEGKSPAPKEIAAELSPPRSSSASNASSSSSSSSTTSSIRSWRSSPSRRSTEDICWVHIWRIDPSSLRIVELNECFNTSVTVTAPASCNTVWQSQSARRSMPGLVLAM